MKKAIVIFSGGPDSTAAALWAAAQGYLVELLTFKFFDGHNQSAELQSAKKVAGRIGMTHTVLDFTGPMGLFSPHSRVLMHVGVPLDTNFKNKPHLLSFGSGMVLSTVACYALYNGIDTVIWGATKDDSYLNVDYTQSFASALANLVHMSAGREFQAIVPFAEKHKYEVLSAYKENATLFSETFSCLTPVKDHHCGVCKACVTRRISAALARVEDNTPYVNTTFINPLSPGEMDNPGNINETRFKKIVTENNTIPNEEMQLH